MEVDEVTTSGELKLDNDSTHDHHMHDPVNQLRLNEEALAEIMFLPESTKFAGELRMHPKHNILMRYFDSTKYQ